MYIRPTTEVRVVVGIFNNLQEHVFDPLGGCTVLNMYEYT